jgi:HEAT repeat protein
MKSRRSPTSGAEPQISSTQGRARTHPLSGFEPLLGGTRRAGADPERVQALITAATPDDQARLLDYVDRLGQTPIYAHELAQIIPARARQTVGDWHGTFTPGQRVNAMAALARIGSYESILPLIEALDDDISRVRNAARDALTAICRRLDPDDRRTKAVFHVLVEALGLLKVSGRKVIAGILASSPPELVLRPLLRRGLTSREWQARRESAWVLGTLGDARATRRLVDALQDDSAAVRTSAAWALGRLDVPEAIPALGSTLSTDPEEVVRATAVESLGTQLARLDGSDERFAPALGLIVDHLSDTDAVRAAAIEALTGLDSPYARQAVRLARALRSR